MTLLVARANLAFSALLAVLAIGAIVGGLRYGFEVEERIGPGFLPILCGVVLLTCAVVDAAQRLRRRADQAPTTGEQKSDLDTLGRTQKQRNQMLLTVIAMILAATLLVYLVGFIIAFGLLLLGIAVLVEKRRLLPALGVSALVLGVVYVVFAVVLQVPFPAGLLGVI